MGYNFGARAGGQKGPKIVKNPKNPLKYKENVKNSHLDAFLRLRKSRIWTLIKNRPKFGGGQAFWGLKHECLEKSIAGYNFGTQNGGVKMPPSPEIGQK